MVNWFDLKQKVTWPAWKFGVFKVYLASVGIIIGCYFSNFFSHYYTYLWIVAAISWSFTVAYWVTAVEPQSGKTGKTAKSKK